MQCQGYGTLDSACYWSFIKSNNTCNVEKCTRAYSMVQSWYSWNQCSGNCCLLTSYTRQAVINCVDTFHRNLGIGLGIGLGYPIVSFVIFFLVFGGKCDHISAIISVFWPFYGIYLLLAGLTDVLQRCCRELRRENNQVHNDNNNDTIVEFRNEIRQLRKQIQSSKMENSEACIIACGRKRNAIGDCLHLSMCIECTRQGNIKRCPICKNHVAQWRQVYLS